MALRNPGIFGVSNQFVRDIGTEIFKTHKIGTVRVKPGRIESLTEQIMTADANYTETTGRSAVK
jgi:hypothetical protein